MIQGIFHRLDWAMHRGLVLLKIGEKKNFSFSGENEIIYVNEVIALISHFLLEDFEPYLQDWLNYLNKLEFPTLFFFPFFFLKPFLSGSTII
jgi:hypothetical protein